MHVSSPAEERGRARHELFEATIKLAPGIYAVRASAGEFIRPRAINVHTPTTKLDFAIDTGIR